MYAFTQTVGFGTVLTISRGYGRFLVFVLHVRRSVDPTENLTPPFLKQLFQKLSRVPHFQDGGTRQSPKMSIITDKIKPSKFTRSNRSYGFGTVPGNSTAKFAEFLSDVLGY
jgi:hypothetical protein